MFIPVSIAHEYVPEQKSLIKESEGGKKKKESPAQVFGLVTLFSYRFGNIHINLGNPLIVDTLSENLKSQTQKLAFDCFIEVGKNMRVTPTSMISMILLDEPSGALKWEEILAKAQHMILFCNKFNIPITDSMNLSNYEKTLGRTIDILIGNKKVDAIGNTTGKVVFYSIKEEARKEILYFKNTILHHFLVPWIVHMAWMNLFSGHINNVEDLKKFFASQRRQLIHEFYLPTVREFLQKALDIISDSIGRQVTGLEECMNLSHKELYQILKSVAPFARSCNYLIEAYYICGLTLKDLHRELPNGFKMDQYTKRYKEIFEEEKKLQRLIRYPESYSVPLSKSSLEYYIHSKLVDKDGGLYKVSDSSKLAEASGRFESELQSLLLTKLIN
jgi:glycerol-3-phosphate O-acyltransferase